MSDMPGYMTIGTDRLHYQRWGSGPAVLLAFHGYGNNASLFDTLRPYLSERYTVLSFDLPHHGGSAWPDGSELIKPHLADLVTRVAEQHGVDKVSLMGYSMGGRICLGIVEAIPERIDKVLLLATDGLRVNPYYYMATHTALGKRLFRHLVDRPGMYFRIMKLLKALKLVPASRYKFAMHYLEKAESRQKLWRIWMSTGKIIPDSAKVKKLVARYKIPIYIYMGARDKILPPSLASGFSSGLDTVHSRVLNKGHRLLDANSAAEIASSLL